MDCPNAMRIIKGGLMVVQKFSVEVSFPGFAKRRHVRIPSVILKIFSFNYHCIFFMFVYYSLNMTTPIQYPIQTPEDHLYQL